MNARAFQGFESGSGGKFGPTRAKESEGDWGMGANFGKNEKKKGKKTELFHKRLERECGAEKREVC